MLRQCEAEVFREAVNVSHVSFPIKLDRDCRTVVLLQNFVQTLEGRDLSELVPPTRFEEVALAKETRERGCNSSDKRMWGSVAGGSDRPPKRIGS